MDEYKLTKDLHQHIDFNQAYDEDDEEPKHTECGVQQTHVEQDQHTKVEVETSQMKRTSHNSETNRHRNSCGPDILNRKSDQVSMKGYLEKYSEFN